MWKKIKVNSSKIQHNTGKMTLVKLNDSFVGVWIPSKCIRFEGKNDYLAVISLNTDFEYMLSTKEKVSADEVARLLGRSLREEEE